MKKVTFYAVHKGHDAGVFNSWPDCQMSINGYPKAKYQKFTNRKDASYYAQYGEVPNFRPAATSKEGNKLVTIYTDGSCTGNVISEIGSGLVVYLEGMADRAYYGLYDYNSTCNIAELNALKAALEIAPKYISLGYKVEILTDSNYARQCVSEWIYKWKENGWKNSKGRTPDNFELIKICHQLYEENKSSLTINYVGAHSGIEGNASADILAGMAVQKRQEYLIEISVNNIVKSTLSAIQK